MNSASMELFDPQTAALEDLPIPELGQESVVLPAAKEFIERLPRPAWIEIDLPQLEHNFRLIQQEMPGRLGLLSVIKDDAYGHGAVAVAKSALRCGIHSFGLSTLEEAVALRERGIQSRILLLGDRHETELPWCISHDLTCCVSEGSTVTTLARLAEAAGEQVAGHLKINTGMNRYCLHWTQAQSVAAQLCL